MGSTSNHPPHTPLEYSQGSPVTTRYNAPLHYVALIVCIATFPLIFLGGLVTSHSAGMSVPDWPNSYGYNMFLFPPRFWVGGILYEHTHRLYAAFVGLLTVALTIVAWWTDKRPAIRWLATSTLGMVIIQGILGGLRVTLVQLDLAIVHACVAQAFFCLTAMVVVVTSHWWTSRHLSIVQPDVAGEAESRLARLAGFTTLIIYLQLIAGAVMRHYQAGLAIPDFPLSYGHLLPPISQHALDSINSMRVWNLQLEPVTMAQIWIHFAHRIGAVLVTLFVTAVVATTLLHFRHNRALVRPALSLVALILIQLTLGAMTVLLKKPADIASAHVAVGALVLVTTFVLTLRAHRVASVTRNADATMRLSPEAAAGATSRRPINPEGFRPLSA